MRFRIFDGGKPSRRILRPRRRHFQGGRRRVRTRPFVDPSRIISGYQHVFPKRSCSTAPFPTRPGVSATHNLKRPCTCSSRSSNSIAERYAAESQFNIGVILSGTGRKRTLAVGLCGGREEITRRTNGPRKPAWRSVSRSSRGQVDQQRRRNSVKLCHSRTWPAGVLQSRLVLRAERTG